MTYYIVDTLGRDGTGRLVFDTERQAEVVVAEFRRTTSLKVVMWCCGDDEEGQKRPSEATGADLSDAQPENGFVDVRPSEGLTAAKMEADA